MNDFALVTEGATDQTILENILIGYFKDQREPEIHRDHPDPQAAKRYDGWTLVLQYLREKRYVQAFQLNQWLIVRIDTDVAEDVGFDVPRQNEQGPLDLAEFVRNVVERLKTEIGQEDFLFYNDRFIFAIGVEQLECWVLPIWFDDAKGAQIASCTNRLRDCPQLRNALDEKNLRWIQREKKDPRSYDLASREYRKRGPLLAKGSRNPSLAIFLAELERRAIQLPVLE